MSPTKLACLLSCRSLAKQGALYLWSFTFDRVVPLNDARKKWNHLLTLLMRNWPRFRGVRVFELHQEHGLHIHLVTNRFIKIGPARELSLRAGWGRVHVQPLPGRHAGYLCKHLDAKRPACFKGWRIWAAFGKGWKPTRSRDIVKDSLFSRCYRACKEWKGWLGKANVAGRMAMARRMFLKTIEHGWPDGRGPGGKPYSECSDQELHLW